VPLKTGFVPDLTEAGRTLAANTLERLEESIRQNDPRFNSPSPASGRSGLQGSAEPDGSTECPRRGEGEGEGEN
jgi:hypothetical protein